MKLLLAVALVLFTAISSQAATSSRLFEWESERAGVLAAPDHLHFRASVRQIERYEAGSSEDARRIPRCLNGCCPELRKLTIGYLAGPD